MKDFTVLIAVYNCEQFLNRMFNSILNQTYPLKNIHVIVLNDGSTDNSEKICKQYKKKFVNFEYFSEANKGQGMAKEFLLQKVNTEYFTYLDADDYWLPNCCKNANEILEKNDYDILSTQVLRGKDGCEPYYWRVFSFSKTTDLFDRHISSWNQCGKFWKTSLIKKLDHHFIDVRWAEDVGFGFMLLLIAKVGWTKVPSYVYWLNTASVSYTNGQIANAVATLKVVAELYRQYAKYYNLLPKKFRHRTLKRIRYIEWQQYQIFKKINS